MIQNIVSGIIKYHEEIAEDRKGPWRDIGEKLESGHPVDKAMTILVGIPGTIAGEACGHAGPYACIILSAGGSGVGRGATLVDDAAGQLVSSHLRFEGLTNAHIQKIRRALEDAGIDNVDLLLQGADMPDGYFAMTLGEEGFAINRRIIDDHEELIRTLRHELQHLMDRRSLGDPGAYGEALEEAARAAERSE